MTGSQAARRLGPTAAFAALAAYTVARTALRFANSDDFNLALGKWPPSPSWLWAQHNEHRLALPKLLLAFSARHGDFRGGVWLSWALVTAASAWLVVRVDRGWAVALLVPAVLLCPANNAWHWDVELQFAACAAIGVVAFTHALTARGAADAAVVAIASLLLPLTGGNGLVLSGATIVAALFLARERTLPTAARALFTAGAVATIAVDVAYLHGYQAPPQHEALHADSLGQLVVVAAHLLVAPLGSIAARFVVVAAPLVVLALVAAALAIAREPRRAVVASFFAGNLAVAAAIAVARAGRGWPAGLEAHYASLVAPLYVLALVALAPAAARFRGLVIAAAGAAAAMCIAYVPTATPLSRLDERAFIADCGRAPVDVVVSRYLPLFYYVDTPEARRIVATYVVGLDCAALRR